MHIERSGNIVKLYLNGMLTTNSSIALESQLREFSHQPEDRIILDFKEVSLITSAGIRVIVSFAQQMKAKRNPFAICEIATNVRKMFTITGFDQLLPIYETQQDAVEALTE